MEQIQSLNEIFNLLLRRVPVWGTIAAIGLVGSVIYALSLPRLYETTAIIQIGNTQLSEQVNNENSSALPQYLRKIEQRIMARDNLMQVISDHGLYEDHPDIPASEKVLQLRLATSIKQILDPGQSWRPDATPSALTVTVRLGDPDLTARVANDFAARVLEQNRAARVKQANQAFAFFESEEQRVNAAISALDARIATFKSRYAESLPTAQTAQHELLVSLEDAKLAMDQQIIELNSSKDKFRKAEFEQQLGLAEEQRKLIASRRDIILSSIDAAPQVEKEYNALQRNMKQLEDQYSVITKNRAEAEIGQMLQAGAQSEQLSVLETALVPDVPVSPNRKKIVAVGGAVSLGVAAIVVLVLEMLNPVIRTAAQLERHLQISPVVTIPIVKTKQDKIIQRVILAVSTLLGGIGLWQFFQFITRNTG